MHRFIKLLETFLRDLGPFDIRVSHSCCRFIGGSSTLHFSLWQISTWLTWYLSCFAFPDLNTGDKGKTKISLLCVPLITSSQSLDPIFFHTVFLFLFFWWWWYEVLILSWVDIWWKANLELYQQWRNVWLYTKTGKFYLHIFGQTCYFSDIFTKTYSYYKFMLINQRGKTKIRLQLKTKATFFKFTYIWKLHRFDTVALLLW